MELITFIGNGNMALSLALGLKDTYDIEVIGRCMNKLEEFEKNLNKPIKKFLINEFDITDKNILLCIKPNNIVQIGQMLKGKANGVHSILAGVSIETITENIKTKSVVRAMPNIAASVKKSITSLTGDDLLKTQAINIFDSIGSTVWFHTQKELDIATALGGSGPAFLALVVEALSDGAVAQGLKREDSIKIIEGLFEGFGVLIKNTHPAYLKDKVMSPGGTTASGYSTLEKYKVRSAFIDAIQSSYHKAKKLSKD